MVKLSKAQEKVMNDCKAKIDEARRITVFEEWVKLKTNRMIDAEYWINLYDDYKNGICLTYANSKTLLKLEQLGLIQIIDISTGQTFGIDRIKVLNY